MKEYNFFKQDALRPTEEQRLLTKQFYQKSVEIYARFDDWKDIDKFYFIPLYLEMTYSCGWVAEIAPDPVWLGSFVRCTLEHPDLFQYNCPDCGRPIHPYRYVGSPLNGVVHLEGRCECGWHGFEEVSGWRVRAIALRDQLASDKGRYQKYKLLHPGATASTVDVFWVEKGAPQGWEVAAEGGQIPTEAAASQAGRFLRTCDTPGPYLRRKERALAENGGSI